MRKLSEVFESSHYVLENLAYSNSKGKTAGKKEAEAAKETLQEELNQVEPILESINLEYHVSEHIISEITKLKICLKNLNTSYSTNDKPLNIILWEYFDKKREELQEYFSELGI